MHSLPPWLRRPILVLMFATLPLLSCWLRDYSGFIRIVIPAGPDTVFLIKEAFITAKPGTIIELPAGRFEFFDELSIAVDHIYIKGKGMDQTILDFSKQEHGAQGILVTGDEFAIEDLAIENAAGDGIRAQDANGLLFRNIRVEWTNGPDTSNGAYGIYPVFTRDVIIEGCVVIGASDAGIYVGQSHDVVVRNSRVEFNVAGIEIENTQDADVHDNIATNNSGGILIFDLPFNPVKGRRNRVFNNRVFSNNTENFAPPGNIVAEVPGGTGIIVMANKGVEIFGNWITQNQTVNVAIVSYLVLQEGNPDSNYDPYPEIIEVHDNDFGPGGFNPRPRLGSLLKLSYFRDDMRDGASSMPDIIWDGYKNPDNVVGDELPDELNLCIRNNRFHTIGGAVEAITFGNVERFMVPAAKRDLADHDCSHAPLRISIISPQPDLPEPEEEFTPEEIAALCGAVGAGVNWDALVVNCPNLSDYRLFDDGDPTGAPSGSGVPFDLTTPLFSDYASKYRVLFLPDGESASYHETDPFEFPVGTVIAKTFVFPFDLRDPSLGKDWVETRLLIHREAGWIGIPYIWNAGRTEAFLSLGGGGKQVTFTHFDGTERTTNYRVPDANQCKRCHGHNMNEGGTIPIGPKARLLNRDYPYGSGEENQLTHWTNLGILTGAPAASEAPRIPPWDGAEGTLEERARGYLESNCAHCHSPEGGARFSSLFLTADRPVDANYGVCKVPVAAGAGSGSLIWDLVPGDPDASVLLFRINSAVPEIRMPELSKSIVHTEGVELVRAWIASLPPMECGG